MKKFFLVTALSCTAFLTGSTKVFATEAVGVKYGEKLPKGIENAEVVIFDTKNGKESKASREYKKRKKSAEKLEERTPVFKTGSIKLIGQTPIPALPGHSLWTYQVSGLTPIAPSRLVRLVLEKTPPKLKLALPATCIIKGKVDAERFDPILLKDIPNADALCTQVSKKEDITYFEKRVPFESEIVKISIVATSISASPLIAIEAKVDGYKTIKAMLPGPDVE